MLQTCWYHEEKDVVISSVFSTQVKNTCTSFVLLEKHTKHNSVKDNLKATRTKNY